MPTLRLTQSAQGEDQHRVEIALEGDRRARRTAVSHFRFALNLQDQEDTRWYLEDYLQYPLEPAPKIAARIESRMAEPGAELFAAIFRSNDSPKSRAVCIDAGILSRHFPKFGIQNSVTPI